MNFLVETLQNIFTPTPPTFSNYTIFFMILAGAFVAGGIALKFYIKARKEDKSFKRSFRNYPFKLITLGILLGIYIFMRHYAVAFLSMRLLMIALVITMIYTVYQMYNSYTKQYPELQKHEKDKLEKNKYSTKKHKK